MIALTVKVTVVVIVGDVDHLDVCRLTDVDGPPRMREIVKRTRQTEWVIVDGSRRHICVIVSDLPSLLTSCDVDVIFEYKTETHQTCHLRAQYSRNTATFTPNQLSTIFFQTVE